MKILIRLIWVAVFVAIIALGGSIIISKYYENSLKIFAVQQLNKQLAAKIDVEDVELTVFKKFPFTSLDFKNVVAKDALIKIGEQDTLFYFKHAYLQFNLIDIIKNRFILREITLENGFVNPRVTKEGYDNYHIFKKTESSANNFLINLKQVTLNNVVVDYTEEKRNDYLKFNAEKAYLKGEFSKDEFELSVYGAFNVKTITISKKEVLAKRDVNLDVGIYINNGVKHYEIRTGKLVVDNTLHFEVTGTIDNVKTPIIDVKCKGINLDIVKSLTLLPKQYANKIKKYKSEGQLTFSSSIKGEMKGEKIPNITAVFSIKNGKITESVNNIELQNVNLEGNYSQNNLDLKNISFRLKGGEVSGNYKITGSHHPLIKTNITAEFDLKTAKEFLQLDTLTNLEGKLNIEVNYEGNVEDINKLKSSDLKRAKTEGTVKLQNVSFGVKGSNKRYKNVNAELSLHGNNMLISELKGETGGSDFSLTGIFSNMLSYLIIEDEKLTVEAEFNSNMLNFNELLQGNQSSSDTTYLLVLPKNINLNLKTTIGKLTFRRFSATNVTGVVTYTNNKLKISPLNFEAMGGYFLGNYLFYPLSNGNYKLIATTNIEHVDVTQLFYELENFGQTELKSTHLKGTANASIIYRSEMNNKLEVDLKKLYTNVDVAIKNGELIEYKQLYSVSDYIKSNKLLNIFVKADELRKELEHIKFSTLRNQILIKNETITIPQMEIYSSAMNLVAEGTHTFDNKINYKINFYLSDLLTKNRERQNKEGKTQIFLTVKGTTENPVVEYNKMVAKQKIAQEIKKEKQEVKQILKEEFGWFEKDTTLHKATPVDKKLDFEIEWDEENPQQNEKNNKNKTAKQRFLNKIKEKEKNNTDDFDFEEDDF